MAYSDYGGYAYRNGEHVIDRSDVVLSPEGLKSTPGVWPGFVLDEGRNGGSHHVILGDGPIFVSLYKQSCLRVYRLSEQIDLPEFDSDSHDENNPFVFEVDGVKITAVFECSDNYYQYVKIEQPDGTVWTGFSGYGVGAGLEDCGYGFSTEDQAQRLAEIMEKLK